jgi:hypothetical protein
MDFEVCIFFMDSYIFIFNVLIDKLFKILVNSEEGIFDITKIRYKFTHFMICILIYSFCNTTFGLLMVFWFVVKVL